MLTPLPVALALWRLQLLRGDELPAIATTALQNGIDTPSLRVLAGLLGPTRDEAGPLLERAASELGFSTPTVREAILAVSRFIAQQILDGEVSPYDGARRIWSLWDNDYPDELLGFIGAASQIEDFVAKRVSDPEKYDQLVTQCEGDIRDLARTLVQSIAA